MTPSVRERREFRFADALPVAGVDLRDAQAGAGSADQHFRREFHAGRAQFELRQAASAESANPDWLSSTTRRPHHACDEERDRRRPQEPMEEWHRRSRRIVEPVAEHEVRRVALDRCDELGDLAQRVREVCVGHDDDVVLRSPKPSP